MRRNSWRHHFTCGLALSLMFSSLWVMMDSHQPVRAVENAEGKIVFVRVGNLWVMNPDGSHQQDLGVKGNRPSWSPEGTQIVFQRHQDLPPHVEIFIVNADGTNLRQLTKVPQGAQRTIQDLYPAWSPDGRKIAFTSTRDGNAEIYLMDADGQNQTNLTHSPETHDIMPAWSPDGEKMVYYDATDGHLYTIHLKDLAKERLTHTVADRWEPAWSPDGTQIAFDGVQGRTTDIFIINADGRNERRLTDHLANDSCPTWSPDGTQIVFQSDRDGDGWNLYRLTIASEKIEQLTNDRGEHPDWNRPAAPPTSVGAAGRKWVRWGEVKAGVTSRSNPPVPFVSIIPFERRSRNEKEKWETPFHVRLWLLAGGFHPLGWDCPPASSRRR